MILKNYFGSIKTTSMRIAMILVRNDVLKAIAKIFSSTLIFYEQKKIFFYSQIDDCRIWL